MPKDFLQEKGKRYALDQPIEAIIHFIIYLITFTPLLVFVILPLTTVYQLFIKIGLVKEEEDEMSVPIKPSSNLTEKPTILKRATDLSGREYDLILYGATGFTGRLAAHYLAKQYPATSFKWAIGGRNQNKLQELRTELMTKYPSLVTKENNNPIGIVSADAIDYENMTNLVQRTKVVITAAGPFTYYGETLVLCCVENGTHYCDITAETNWVRDMITKYQSAAIESGANIVHFCGHDCIPWDLSVLKCVRALQKRGEELIDVKAYDGMNGDMSGGTVESMQYILKDKVGESTDVLLKLNDSVGTISSNQVVYNEIKILQYDSIIQKWIAPFIMSNVMANCLVRSNALLNYSPRFLYQEAQIFPNFFSGFVSFERVALFVLSYSFPPLHRLLRSKMLPKPGNGPSEASMDAGFLQVQVIAKGNKGSVVQSMIYYPHDAGYRDTARMLIESGLVLAIETHKVKVKGGFWTPASCQGEALLSRLIESGCHFEIKMK